MLSYRATLDVPVSTVARVSRWLQAHRRRVDTRPWQRAATCWTQAILVLRWLKDGTDIDLLARDAKVSQATGYRYLHEAITAGTSKWSPTRAGSRSGFPRSNPAPHDLNAARVHVLPALYPAAAAGLPTLADKGYVGAGIGIQVPFKGANLCPDNRTRNLLISALRAPPNAPTLS